MIRRPDSKYENCRSKSLLKVKTQHDEEAKVVGHEGGKGKYTGSLGALTLTTPDGRQFSCGTGLTDSDRSHPPAIGSVVTYKYTELMDNGYPRFPVYVGPRTDLDWEDICASYVPCGAAGPGKLEREHSILYAEKIVTDTLLKRTSSISVGAGESDESGNEQENGVSDDEECDMEEDSPPKEEWIGLPEGRPKCKFGPDCYRKNPDHFLQFSHPAAHPRAPKPEAKMAAFEGNETDWKTCIEADNWEQVHIHVGGNDYALRDHQKEELRKWWVGEKIEKEWLLLKNGIPVGFAAHGGKVDKLTLSEASEDS